jgi:hypothetical protein
MRSKFFWFKLHSLCSLLQQLSWPIQAQSPCLTSRFYTWGSKSEGVSASTYNFKPWSKWNPWHLCFPFLA